MDIRNSGIFRITIEDTVQSAIIKISEGNPGALTCMMELLEDRMGYNFMLMLDSLEIYGEKIYMLWNDCCDRDITRMKLIIKNWQQGYITMEEIHEHISGGYGKPFDNVKSQEEIDKEIDDFWNNL